MTNGNKGVHIELLIGRTKLFDFIIASFASVNGMTRLLCKSSCNLGKDCVSVAKWNRHIGIRAGLVIVCRVRVVREDCILALMGSSLTQERFVSVSSDKLKTETMTRLLKIERDPWIQQGSKDISTRTYI